VFIEAGGTVTNSGTASRIEGIQYGVGASRVAATIVNQGSIFGDGYSAIYLGAGGAVRNTGTAALISGARWGIYAYGSAAATVTNQGTISGGNAAVHFDNANGNIFLDFPGAVATGGVQGGTGTDTLELASAAAIGTITGIGSAFTGFEALVVDTGAHWLLTGANTLAATASIRLTGTGSLGVTGTLTAPGKLTVTGAGTLAASGGRIEVGTAGTAIANQIVVDAAHTLLASGVLSSAAVVNAGTIEANGGTLTLTGTVGGSGTLQANAGATLTLKGPTNTAASVLNQGTLRLAVSTSLDITGAVNVASTGLFILNNASLLEVAADAGASNTIEFLGTGGLVVDAVGLFGSNVGSPAYKGPLIEKFGVGDSIDLKDLVSSGAADTYDIATGLLQLTNGATKATLAFQNSSLGAGTFHLGSDSGGHVLLTHS
jgi:hypothetical protein